MTEYEYKIKQFHPAADDTVTIPDDAIGATITTWGDPQADPDDWVTVRYLLPEDSDA